jgi:uncharacterized damage-inducible protein DinB
MEITNVETFLPYYRNIRERTMRVVECIPPDKIEWRYREGKWSFGDILRHIAAIERHMWGETVQGKPPRYAGCGPDIASGYDNVVAYMRKMHDESCDIFAKLTPDDLQAKCMTPADTPVTVWKWLRALCEHEVHHRGQLYTYLGLLDIAGPPLYGLTSEQVAAKTQTILLQRDAE